MGDNVESDLLYEDFQNEDQKEFNNENYGQEDDLYDDVLTSGSNNLNSSDNNLSAEHNPDSETNGSYQGGMHSIARRFQLYIGNLTWWTTDQDISDAVVATGVSDFQEVKFFENRANGQSKGFCVITLGSEGSMRIVLENFAKKELNGQTPVVTLPTKQALNQFESIQKTRPAPPIPPNGQKPMPPMMNPNMPPQGNMHPRMMNPNNPMMRGPMPMQNSPNMPMRMSGPNTGPPPMNHPNPQMNNMPPRFQNNWNNGPPPRGGPNIPGNRPPPPGHPMNQGGHPMMNQGPMMNRPPMGNRPFGPNRQMHPGNFNQGPQNMNNMGGGPPPRGPIQMGGGPPAPHVNPAFFNQSGPMNPQQPGAPGPFNQQGPRPGMWPQQGNKMPPFEGPNQPIPNPGVSQPPISEAEFEEIMGRNRTVSSSAIARAVSDAAAGETTSAMETLATAISLIKQSKIANDGRCKILISSLQDTLQGIEAKSYIRRERSDRSRSRERRRRRERSNSRSYSRRSRSREHRDHRGRDDRYYGSENYHSSRDTRERSRSRGNTESHYRGGDESNSRSRPRNKSPEPSNDSNSETYKRSNEDRSRDDRYRERETRNRH